MQGIDAARHARVYVGKNSESVGWGKNACNEVLPNTKLVAGIWIISNLVKADFEGPIQLVRFKCGSRCKLDIYKVEIL